MITFNEAFQTFALVAGLVSAMMAFVPNPTE